MFNNITFNLTLTTINIFDSQGKNYIAQNMLQTKNQRLFWIAVWKYCIVSVKPALMLKVSHLFIWMVDVDGGLWFFAPHALMEGLQ